MFVNGRNVVIELITVAAVDAAATWAAAAAPIIGVACHLCASAGIVAGQQGSHSFGPMP